MSMMRYWQWALGGAVVLGAGVALAERHPDCDASNVFVRPLNTGAQTVPQRLANTQKYIAQLNCLGYGPLALTADGTPTDVTAFTAALTRFNATHATDIAPYTAAGIDASLASICVLDDYFRANVGAPVASDYKAPTLATASGQLFGPGRHRRRA